MTPSSFLVVVRVARSGVAVPSSQVSLRDLTPIPRLPNCRFTVLLLQKGGDKGFIVSADGRRGELSDKGGPPHPPLP